VNPFIVNLIFGALFASLLFLKQFIAPELIALILIILLGISFRARLTLSNALSFSGPMGSNYGRILLIPLFLYVAVIDLYVISVCLQNYFPETSRLPSPWNFVLLLLIVLSLVVMFKEAINVFTSMKYVSDLRQNLANWVFLLYGAVASVYLWEDIADKLVFQWNSPKRWEELAEGFMYYLIFVVPMERYVIIKNIRNGRPWYLTLLSLTVGFAFVCWSIIEW
jgi:hypothetical protein